MWLATLLASCALDPSLAIRFCDLHLRLQCTYERALALQRIGGPHHRRARLAALQLARVAGETRASPSAYRCTAVTAFSSAS